MMNDSMADNKALGTERGLCGFVCLCFSLAALWNGLISCSPSRVVGQHQNHAAEKEDSISCWLSCRVCCFMFLIIHTRAMIARVASPISSLALSLVLPCFALGILGVEGEDHDDDSGVVGRRAAAVARSA